MKICILTQSHLCRNPRVVKEANALAEAGYQVTILTTFTYKDLLDEDYSLLNKEVEYRGIINLIPEQSNRFYRFKERVKRRIAGEMISRFGLETPYALGYDYRKNLKEAIKENAEFYLCHQEISTIIGVKLLRKGFRVGFDFEDWYSHDLLPDANKTRPIKLLEKAEKFALKHAQLAYTTSESLAKALADFAKSKKPKVLHNVFPFSERASLDGLFKDRKNLKLTSIHWYSQTIGPGRGLEFFIDALHSIQTPLEVHLRGNIFGKFKEVLIEKFPFNKGHEIYFHPLVSHKELLSRIAEHDIGLATEEYTPESRNLTITNKILQYLQAGIAVVASDTSGQKEVAELAPRSVFLFRNNNPDSLIKTLSNVLSNQEKLDIAKKEAIDICKEKLSWELQKKNLLNWIEKAISNK